MTPVLVDHVRGTTNLELPTAPGTVLRAPKLASCARMVQESMTSHVLWSPLNQSRRSEREVSRPCLPPRDPGP